MQITKIICREALVIAYFDYQQRVGFVFIGFQANSLQVKDSFGRLQGFVQRVQGKTAPLQGSVQRVQGDAE
jgi:hypothetical protein